MIWTGTVTIKGYMLLDDVCTACGCGNRDPCSKDMIGIADGAIELIAENFHHSEVSVAG